MSSLTDGPAAGEGRGRWTLILGGSRSGKSSLGEALALKRGGRDVLFVATGEALDAEMRERILHHQEGRAGYGWRTLEAPRDVAERLAGALTGSEKVVLLDCMTLLASNAVCGMSEDMPSAEAEARLTAEVQALVEVMRRSPADWIVISNEVGLGLVPPYKLGRLYRDALGRANQRLAAAADEVILMVAGLQMRLKG
jgi:adenosylcobinamide kinase/adenosylcobinamide-phosphate guanylyltransferase